MSIMKVGFIVVAMVLVCGPDSNAVAQNQTESLSPMFQRGVPFRLRIEQVLSLIHI